MCCFSHHLGILEPQNTVKQGKCENHKSTLFTPLTGGVVGGVSIVIVAISFFCSVCGPDAGETNSMENVILIPFLRAPIASKD